MKVRNVVNAQREYLRRIILPVLARLSVQKHSGRTFRVKSIGVQTQTA